MSDSDLLKRVDRLHQDLNDQGSRVASLATRAFDAVFDADAEIARKVIAEDDEIDAVDIRIERAAVDLLTAGITTPRAVRMILTIVKVNNELERIADLSADVAEQVVLVDHLNEALPPTMRVMVNSVIGMLRDTNRAMQLLDLTRARSVLTRDVLVEEFKTAIMREAQEQFAQQLHSIEVVQAMWRIASATNRIADHATNICEQVIYVESGRIVRHSVGGWSEPMDA